MKTFWIAAVGAVIGLGLIHSSGYAQPILKRVEDLLRDQLSGTKAADQAAERGYLGLIGDDTPDNSGVQLLEVYPNQPAAQGGL